MPRKTATTATTATKTQTDLDTGETEFWDGNTWVPFAEDGATDDDGPMFEMERYEEPDHDSLAAAIAQDEAEAPDEDTEEEEEEEVSGEFTLQNPEWPEGSYSGPARTAHVDEDDGYELTKVDPNAYIVPPGEVFLDSEGNKLDFYYDQDLDALIRDVIATHPAKFSVLQDIDIQGWWQKKGRIVGGKMEFARPTKPTGMIRQLTSANVLIYFAHDHIGSASLSHETMKKLIAHELCHITIGKKNKVTMRDHDFEGFAWEYKEFGPWRSELADITRIANTSQFTIPEFAEMVGATA